MSISEQARHALNAAATIDQARQPEPDLDDTQGWRRRAMLAPLMPINRLYANGHDLAHPYLSPLFGDVTGYPPTFLQTGTRDLFLSNTVRMHRTLLAAAVPTELHVFEAMPHGGFGGQTPEDTELAATARRFAEQHLQPTSRQDLSSDV